jgi:hypothetical protein
MTQFVKVLSEGIRPPDEKQVVALLYDDALPETRQIVVIMQLGFSAHDHIAANFGVLWDTGAVVPNGWANETERDDIRLRANEAITSINQGITVLDGTPTNAQVIAVVRGLLVIVRKLIRFLVTE